MRECAGVKLEVEPEPKLEEKLGSGGALTLVLGLGCGGAFTYITPKQGAKANADPNDYEFQNEGDRGR